MYIGEGGLVEEIREEVVRLLRALGIKHTLKKSDYKLQAEKRIEVYHVFKTSLELLEKEKVVLPQSGAQVEVPVFVIDSCKFIEQNLTVEGLFRKAGSTSKQRELRAVLDCGSRLEINADHHVINVGNILKLFFRELPEPLIPFKFHNLFLRCLTVKQRKVEALLLSCLLLPNDHLNTLAYLLTFLNSVTLQKDVNKMDVGNLAIIFTPSIMPVDACKLTTQGSEKINHHVLIVQTLIENAAGVGVLPDSISSKIDLNLSSSTVEMDTSFNDSMYKKRRKKRRSNSLTKMITGIKKIMTKSSPEVEVNALVSPAPNMMLHTPKMISTRKRKTESQGLSTKKKCDVLNILPGKSALANTPLKVKYSSTTMLTPRTLITDLKRDFTPYKQPINKPPISSNKLFKNNCNESALCSRPLLNNKDVNVSEENKRKKASRNRFNSQETPNNRPCEIETEEYIRIPKQEYEDIKMRVNNIENCLENELENILGVSISDFEDSKNEKTGAGSPFSKVENAYAKTVKESGKISLNNEPISRELRIRRNSERIIRSPSARKIGSIRRRSRENLSKTDLFRHASLTLSDRPRGLDNNNLSSRCLRRGRPNTVFSGLPQRSPQLSTASDDVEMIEPVPKVQQSVKNDSWESADNFFSKSNSRDDLNIDESGRESVVKIRNQNAGMVLAKAKLFDSMEKTNNYENVEATTEENTNETGESIPVDRFSQRNLQRSKFTQSTSHLGLKSKVAKVRSTHSFNSTPSRKTEIKSPLRNIERSKSFKRNCVAISPKKLKRPGDRVSPLINDIRRKSPRFIHNKNVIVKDG